MNSVFNRHPHVSSIEQKRVDEAYVSKSENIHELLGTIDGVIEEIGNNVNDILGLNHSNTSKELLCKVGPKNYVRTSNYEDKLPYTDSSLDRDEISHHAINGDAIAIVKAGADREVYTGPLIGIGNNVYYNNGEQYPTLSVNNLVNTYKYNDIIYHVYIGGYIGTIDTKNPTNTNNINITNPLEYLAEPLTNNEDDLSVNYLYSNCFVLSATDGNGVIYIYTNTNKLVIFNCISSKYTIIDNFIENILEIEYCNGNLYLLDDDGKIIRYNIVSGEKFIYTYSDPTFKPRNIHSVKNRLAIFGNGHKYILEDLTIATEGLQVRDLGTRYSFCCIKFICDIKGKVFVGTEDIKCTIYDGSILVLNNDYSVTFHLENRKCLTASLDVVNYVTNKYSGDRETSTYHIIENIDNCIMVGKRYDRFINFIYINDEKVVHYVPVDVLNNRGGKHRERIMLEGNGHSFVVNASVCNNDIIVSYQDSTFTLHPYDTFKNINKDVSISGNLTSRNECSINTLLAYLNNNFIELYDNGVYTKIEFATPLYTDPNIINKNCTYFNMYSKGDGTYNVIAICNIRNDWLDSVALMGTLDRNNNTFTPIKSFSIEYGRMSPSTIRYSNNRVFIPMSIGNSRLVTIDFNTNKCIILDINAPCENFYPYINEDLSYISIVYADYDNAYKFIGKILPFTNMFYNVDEGNPIDVVKYELTKEIFEQYAVKTVDNIELNDGNGYKIHNGEILYIDNLGNVDYFRTNLDNVLKNITDHHYGYLTSESHSVKVGDYIVSRNSTTVKVYSNITKKLITECDICNHVYYELYQHSRYMYNRILSCYITGLGELVVNSMLFSITFRLSTLGVPDRRFIVPKKKNYLGNLDLIHDGIFVSTNDKFLGIMDYANNVVCSDICSLISNIGDYYNKIPKNGYMRYNSSVRHGTNRIINVDIIKVIKTGSYDFNEAIVGNMTIWYAEGNRDLKIVKYISSNYNFIKTSDIKHSDMYIQDDIIYVCYYDGRVIKSYNMAYNNNEYTVYFEYDIHKIEDIDKYCMFIRFVDRYDSNLGSNRLNIEIGEFNNLTKQFSTYYIDYDSYKKAPGSLVVDPVSVGKIDCFFFYYNYKLNNEFIFIVKIKDSNILGVYIHRDSGNLVRHSIMGNADLIKVSNNLSISLSYHDGNKDVGIYLYSAYGYSDAQNYISSASSSTLIKTDDIMTRYHQFFRNNQIFVTRTSGNVALNNKPGQYRNNFYETGPTLDLVGGHVLPNYNTPYIEYDVNFNINNGLRYYTNVFYNNDTQEYIFCSISGDGTGTYGFTTIVNNDKDSPSSRDFRYEISHYVKYKDIYDLYCGKKGNYFIVEIESANTLHEHRIYDGKNIFLLYDEYFSSDAYLLVNTSSNSVELYSLHYDQSSGVISKSLLRTLSGISSEGCSYIKDNHGNNAILVIYKDGTMSTIDLYTLDEYPITNISYTSDIYNTEIPNSYDKDEYDYVKISKLGKFTSTALNSVVCTVMVKDKISNKYRVFANNYVQLYIVDGVYNVNIVSGAMDLTIYVGSVQFIKNNLLECKNIENGFAENQVLTPDKLRYYNSPLLDMDFGLLYKNNIINVLHNANKAIDYIVEVGTININNTLYNNDTVYGQIMRSNEVKPYITEDWCIFDNVKNGSLLVYNRLFNYDLKIKYVLRTNTNNSINIIDVVSSERCILLHMADNSCMVIIMKDASSTNDKVIYDNIEDNNVKHYINNTTMEIKYFISTYGKIGFIGGNGVYIHNGTEFIKCKTPTIQYSCFDNIHNRVYTMCNNIFGYVDIKNNTYVEIKSILDTPLSLVKTRYNTIEIICRENVYSYYNNRFHIEKFDMKDINTNTVDMIFYKHRSKDK